MLDLVLCVDDDPITLMLCKKVISKAEFSAAVVTAKNGEEALKYFNDIKNEKIEINNLPQLIFLDLNMPVMDGWEFLDNFNTPEYSDYNSTKVVVLSSTIDPQDLEKAKKYQIVFDFLSKPISPSMLDYLKSKL